MITTEGPVRMLVLCTHNSARSQMMEGQLRHHAQEAGTDLEICSAGSEKTRVKQRAITVMAEVGIDLTTHTSKTLHELPDPWSFDLALTVCDDANEACPTYPAHTIRRHLSIPDPSEHDLTTWRQVRDGLGRTSRLFIDQLTRRQTPSNAELAAALTAPPPTS